MKSYLHALCAKIEPVADIHLHVFMYFTTVWKIYQKKLKPQTKKNPEHGGDSESL